MSGRVAVDIGGTFTDLVAFEAATGAIVREKTLTTVGELEAGVLRVVEKSGLDPSRLEMFIHGSTVAINAFLEGNGAKTALLTTRGFGDVYEMGRKTRPDMYNLFFEPRRHLVPRSARYEVDERIAADGTVIQPLDEDHLRALIRGIPGDVEALAICFLHSYAHPANERLAGRIAAEERPEAFVSISTDVSREMREYERTSTAVMNAYVGPRVSTYLTALERRLADRGFAGNALLTQSNGGIMSLETAQRQPVRMMESGPAAGVIAAAHVCRRLAIRNAIAFDMGGTTAKACVIEGGEPEIAAEYYVGGRMTGLPVQVPFLEIVEVGAGGGSLARVDEAGALLVGPESAGSSPGPACYGLGGEQPTITDANLVAGRIDHARFLGGEMALDVDAAERALGGLADALGVDLDEAADGVIRLANSIMGHAIRAVTIERGRDPRDFALLCYGGGGPVHAVDLAAELEIPRVIVPVGAATFAAFGMLVADLRHDVSVSFVRRLDEVAPEEAEAAFAGLCEDAEGLFGGLEGDTVFSYRAEARYVGQFHTLNVPLPGPSLPVDQVTAAFDREHARRYGHAAPGEPIELTALRATATRRAGAPVDPPPLAGSQGESRGSRSVLSAAGRRVECAVWRRDELPVGVAVSGPAVIDEPTTSTAIRAQDTVTRTPEGHLLIALGRA